MVNKIVSLLVMVCADTFLAAYMARMAFTDLGYHFPRFVELGRVRSSRALGVLQWGAAVAFALILVVTGLIRHKLPDAAVVLTLVNLGQAWEG